MNAFNPDDSRPADSKAANSNPADLRQTDRNRDLPIVLAITGASGAVYAVRLLQQIVAAGRNVHLTISPAACQVFEQELQFSLDTDQLDLPALLRFRWTVGTTRWKAIDDEKIDAAVQQISYHHYRDYMTPIASGSSLTAGMIICPCSGSTLSGVVHASGGNLIHRAADVHLKERRPLVLVPRETPLSSFQIENMHRAANAGAVVLPASPGWYHGVNDILDLIDFVVVRILDHVGIPNTLMHRWAEETDFADSATTHLSESKE
jgi:4-hydroxy-3-polyprenylbenzoate decarboxylase